MRLAREESLHELICATRRGSQRAADELARRVGCALRTRIRRGIGPTLRARVDTDEILQVTLITTLRDVRRLEYCGDHAFESWLLALMRRQLLMAARYHRRARRSVARERPVSEAARVPSGSPSPYAEAARNEARHAVRRAVDGLPLPHRRIVEMHSYEGFNFREIAAHHGLAGEDAARHLFQKGLAMLADEIVAPQDAPA